MVTKEVCEQKLKELFGELLVKESKDDKGVTLYSYWVGKENVGLYYPHKNEGLILTPRFPGSTISHAKVIGDE